VSIKHFGTIKSEFRVLGIDDGQFTPHTQGNVIVVGVVFRGGYWIDGVMHTEVAIDGLDATDKLSAMINASPHSRQLRLIMLNGVTLGGFNLVDINRLNALTGLPVLALTRVQPDLESIHNALKHLPNWEERWRIIVAAGEIHELNCRGSKLYMVMAGISLEDAQKIVNLTSTRSCFPEPLRVAHLIASGITP
jgi:endonuclease V-like protein UPF0215 family